MVLEEYRKSTERFKNGLLFWSGNCSWGEQKMVVYDLLLITGVLASLFGLYHGFETLVHSKAKAIVALSITFILVMAFSTAAVMAGNLVNKNTSSLENNIAELKNSEIADEQIQNILAELPAEITSNKDFETLKSLVAKLEDAIRNLKNTNEDLKEKNDDLVGEVEDLKDDLDELDEKVSSIGVVVGVY